jgi:hypothetical protein
MTKTSALPPRKILLRREPIGTRGSAVASASQARPANTMKIQVTSQQSRPARVFFLR